MYDGYIHIGFIAKAHSLKGELVLNSERNDIPNSIQTVYLESHSKQLVPYRLHDIRYRPKSGRNTFFLKLDHVDTRNEAEVLVNQAVYVMESDIPEDTQFIEDDLDITGWQITNNGEFFGEIAEVFETPAHFVIEIHHETGSVLIPWVDEYITAIDESNHVVQAQYLERFL